MAMVKSNPFAPLVRMLEQRIARQELSLVESKLQLEAAKESYLRVESEGGQSDLTKVGKK